MWALLENVQRGGEPETTRQGPLSKGNRVQMRRMWKIFVARWQIAKAHGIISRTFDAAWGKNQFDFDLFIISNCKGVFLFEIIQMQEYFVVKLFDRFYTNLLFYYYYYTNTMSIYYKISIDYFFYYKLGWKIKYYLGSLDSGEKVTFSHLGLFFEI